MSAKALSVTILDWRYTIITAPDPLIDGDGYRCKALPDHAERVIWLDPDVDQGERLEVILAAISTAWRDLVQPTAVAD